MIRHHSYYSVDSNPASNDSTVSSSKLAQPRRRRFAYRPMYGYLILAVFVILMSWEQVRTDASAIEGAIPDQSIRLRILANSDAPADQAVKRHVRDAVVEAMNNWVSGPATIDQARETIRTHMGEIEAVIAHELEIRGFEYGFKAELAVVPFPTKMYGSRVYPAGDYEALRITLGKGAGQNWWCVLFPPLCFVDAASGEAEPARTETAAVEQADAKPAKAEGKSDVTTSKASAKDSSVKNTKAEADTQVTKSADEQSGQAPEAKFFLVELFEAIIRFFHNLFA
ncbi:stage II sporulation protein R [Paenibacillus cellulosilyticus]|uniref:Stage II sporulation protein R n=1 Tax=Paenibacillus cellulosilyticus TaxID=375489 RepID=A0A2V2Z2D3_9BACL|nr:stage II sporulation protein R [Paenibacillus cellulosilyticus]PWW08436.1 stage II sporulation protein R [Paenibacillus cellulosilyticus]QKS48024.1 stage II sporulation protein R [Paenibacillus cellulosilyticus]